MNTGRRIIHAGLLMTAVAAVGCHPAPVDPTEKYIHDHPPGSSEDPALNAVSDNEYYTGSDEQYDYYVFLDRSGRVTSRISPEHSSKLWPNPVPRTEDRTKWQLAPGSTAR